MTEALQGAGIYQASERTVTGGYEHFRVGNNTYCFQNLVRDLKETFPVEFDLSKEVGTKKLMAHHLQSDAFDIMGNFVK